MVPDELVQEGRLTKLLTKIQAKGSERLIERNRRQGRAPPQVMQAIEGREGLKAPKIRLKLRERRRCGSTTEIDEVTCFQ